MAEWPPRDALGKIIPHKLNWISFFRAIPPLIGAFPKEVPPEFFARDGDEVVISCPCGIETPVPISTCVECACERFYLATGERVLVANTPEARS